MNTVNACWWTDQIFPTIEPATISPREAAVALLQEADWYGLIESHTYGTGIDPLIVSGLIAEISDAGRYYSKYVSWDRLHVVAWMTAHMVREVWCVNPDHEDPDGRPFGWCPVEDEDSPCQWARAWACIGDLDQLISIATERARNGWTP